MCRMCWVLPSLWMVTFKDLLSVEYTVSAGQRLTCDTLDSGQ